MLTLGRLDDYIRSRVCGLAGNRLGFYHAEGDVCFCILCASATRILVPRTGLIILYFIGLGHPILCTCFNIINSQFVRDNVKGYPVFILLLVKTYVVDVLET